MRMHFEQQGNEIIVGPARITPWVEPHDVRCPKCGMDSRGMVLAYCSGAIDLEFAELLCFGNAAEHLHVQCQRCRFPWLMETKSNAEQRIETSARANGIVPATAGDMKHVSEVMRGLTFLSPQQHRKE